MDDYFEEKGIQKEETKHIQSYHRPGMSKVQPAGQIRPEIKF